MRYLLGVFGVILVVLLLIVVVFSRPSTPSTTKAGSSVVDVTKYANQNAIASVTIRGHLVGETERQAVRISVTPTERRVEVLNGYNETVSRSQSYPNSQAGYEQFLYAMRNAGFAKTKKPAVTEERGMCPNGNQYVYDLTVGSEHPVHSWGTSCTANEGTFAGTGSLIRSLFQAQIPDYSTQISGVRI